LIYSENEAAMQLNRFEYTLMTHPGRAFMQRHFEAPKLLRMGGPLPGGAALEIGCGTGVGTELILSLFRAETVDAFDLDPRMVARASRRLQKYESRVNLWLGDTESIPAADSTYDAVFDFGIIHHVFRWRFALTEIYRVLKPGGRFYGEEVLSRSICHPLVRLIFAHPQHDRFDLPAFSRAMTETGFQVIASKEYLRSFAWIVAAKPPVT
jgi:ubiquinone/menaquinone biosynthesis C-methylase UbiE